MLSPLRILLGGLPMAVLALQPLEPAEFDVAAALAGRGIDIAALPLAAFDALSALNQSVGCTLAVCFTIHYASPQSLTIGLPVCLIDPHLRRQCHSSDGPSCVHRLHLVGVLVYHPSRRHAILCLPAEQIG